MAPVVDNPPGQPGLSWRVAPHSASVLRMRAVLAGDDQPSAVRALARHGTDEPAVAVLDAWAYVADVVSFYTERIAAEGFLRTATELSSVRELARTLGYELRPGVAATAELAFTVEDAPGAPVEVHVPGGTPVQTVPGAGQLPQTFETSQDLPARAVWNAIPGASTRRQVPEFGDTEIWLRGTGLGVRPGDAVLVVGQERVRYGRAGESARVPHDDERWDFRVVETAREDPDGLTGWTLMRVRPRIGYRRSAELVAQEDVQVFAFAERANVFGWNAPDPNLLRGPGDTGVPGTTDPDSDGVLEWEKYGLTDHGDEDVVELDGDHPRLVGGDHTRVADAAWVVLERSDYRELYRVEQVVADGTARYGISGRITRVRVDLTENLTTFGRRETLVHCQSRLLPATRAPRLEGGRGPELDLKATDPPLPAGRRVLVTGYPPGAPAPGPATAAAAHPPPICEPATVLACVVVDDPDPAGEPLMRVTLDRELSTAVDPQTLRVLANTVDATHGETVGQVLGSGDGRAPFAQFQPRRTPLTYVRATTAAGSRSTLELRVDGVAWTEVESLDTATGSDRVFVVRHGEDGAVRLVLGDGTHGARASTGAENVTATYRVGIGADGAATPGQLSLLTRRPFGIRSVTNPGPAHDWAPPETLADARRNAPLRIRTLDRAVSVADHEDFASGFAGVGTARADAVWDGRSTIVAVSLLGTAATPASAGLVEDLRTALTAARDPGTPLELLHGDLRWFGIRVEIRHDPAYERAGVELAVREALAGTLAPALRAFAAPVTAAAVLVTVRSTPGVVACTMPRLLPLPGGSANPSAAVPVLPTDASAADVLSALPARWEDGDLLPAQVLGLSSGGVEIGVMAQ
ncbi:hypothetical protein [Actinopolymorpha sp. B9G3]|uniref:hypothetical protein n=1 Tax=Actinopolymorpha sp. B9G3 TaxID=3158970 RepID=UPI0032D90884